MDHQALANIANRLYALPLKEFIAARTAAAKEAAGDSGKELSAAIRGLAKPSAAAWTVNLLVRSRPDVLAELEELGGRMREAQEKFDAVALRGLGRERRTVLASAVDAARDAAEEAGRPLSNTLATDVEATLRALTADEGAAAAVRTGRLLRTLSADGVQQVSLDGAVAVPEALDVPPARVPTPSSRADRTKPAAVETGKGPEAAKTKAPARGPEPAGPRKSAAAPEETSTAKAPAPSTKPRLVAVQPKERQASSSVLEKAEARAAEARKEADEAARTAEEREHEAEDLKEEVARLRAEAKRLMEELQDVEDRLDRARKQEATAGAEARQLRRAADKTIRSADLAHERVLRLSNTRS